MTSALVTFTAVGATPGPFAVTIQTTATNLPPLWMYLGYPSADAMTEAPPQERAARLRQEARLWSRRRSAPWRRLARADERRARRAARAPWRRAEASEGAAAEGFTEAGGSL